MFYLVAVVLSAKAGLLKAVLKNVYIYQSFKLILVVKKKTDICKTRY